MGIPTALPFGAASFESPGLITISDVLAQKDQGPEFEFYSAYTLRTTGQVYKNYFPVYVSNWVDNAIYSDDFEVRATRTGGTLLPTTGTLNSWLNLGTEREWTLQAVGTCILLIEIRDKNTLEVRDTATVTLKTT